MWPHRPVEAQKAQLLGWTASDLPLTPVCMNSARHNQEGVGRVLQTVHTRDLHVPAASKEEMSHCRLALALS